MDGPVHTFVQYEVHLSMPCTIPHLLKVLGGVPEDAEVDLTDGELLTIRWSEGGSQC